MYEIISPGVSFRLSIYLGYYNKYTHDQLASKIGFCTIFISTHLIVIAFKYRCYTQAAIAQKGAINNTGLKGGQLQKCKKPEVIGEQDFRLFYRGADLNWRPSGHKIQRVVEVRCVVHSIFLTHIPTLRFWQEANSSQHRSGDKPKDTSRYDPFCFEVFLVPSLCVSQSQKPCSKVLPRCSFRFAKGYFALYLCIGETVYSHHITPCCNLHYTYPVLCCG